MRRRVGRGLLAGAVVATLLVEAASAWAAPSDVTVTQQGLSFQVAWTNGPDDGQGGSVQVSSSPDFPDGADTCLQIALVQETALVSCPLAFDGTVYVRVSTFGGDSTDLALPSASFHFAPVAASATPITVRDRGLFRCAAVAADWSNIDGDTTFSARVMSGTTQRAVADLPNPLTGERQSPVDPREIDYRVVPADVGRTLSCEVTATNGALSTTRMVTAVPGHALPAAMDPAAMILSTKAPRGYVFYENPTRTRPTAAQARAGVVSIATGRISLGVSADVDLTATVFRSTRQAQGSIGTSFCAGLRRREHRASTPAAPRTVAQCGPTRIPGANHGYGAIGFATGISDTGERVISAQAIYVGVAAHTQFVVSSTVGGSFSHRRAVIAQAIRAANAAAPSLARAARAE